jgi:tetratricopeptide (TPR) repeat protein
MTKVWLLLFVLPVQCLAASKVDIQGEITAVNRLGTPAVVQLIRGKVAIQETFADSRGRFKFKKVDPGSYTIHVECSGYYGQDIQVEATDRSQPVNITLEATPDEPGSSPAFDPFRELDIPREAKKELDRGMREQKGGECSKGLPHLLRAVAVYPKYADAFTEIGRCYLLMDNRPAAEEAFKKAVQFGAGVFPSVNLSNLYVEEGRLDEAQELITRLLARNPAEGELYATLARIYSAKGRMRDAELAALEAHSRGHMSADVHLILAKIYESQNNPSAMSTQLKTYLEEKPQGPVADQVRRQLVEIEKRGGLRRD